MSQLSSVTSDTQEDRFGRAVAARLSGEQGHLPRDISERLRAAREQALTRRKREPVSAVTVHGHAQATLGMGLSRWWSWGACALPLVVLVAGLVTITQWQADERATEIAEIDAALLTDDLPTAAYTDPGFMQFLQRDRAAQ